MICSNLRRTTHGSLAIWRFVAVLSHSSWRVALEAAKRIVGQFASMSAPVELGEVLAGKYRVERILGAGGMGIVVAAHHLSLDQLIALKFLLPEANANPEARKRFAREARNAVRLKSEHVARIFDVGALDNGASYIVMEFLDGVDLGSLLARERTLPVPVAVDFILQACDAVAEAHALGIIHRDLKPQNLFVTRRHDNSHLIKVLDFGIAKAAPNGVDFTGTTTQAMIGSPGYMSPEQMRATRLVDARTDVWALGIVLHELVLGHKPWTGEAFDLCLKIATEPLPPFPDAGLPPGFEHVLRRCLEKDPDQRFSDVDALAVALSPFAPPHAQPLIQQICRALRSDPPARTLIPPVDGPRTLHETAGQDLARTAARSRRQRIAGLIAALGVTAVVSVVATMLVSGRGVPDANPASARQPALHERAAVQAPPAPSPAPPSLPAPTVAPPSPPPEVTPQPEPAPAALLPDPAPDRPEPPAVAPVEKPNRQTKSRRPKHAPSTTSASPKPAEKSPSTTLPAATPPPPGPLDQPD